MREYFKMSNYNLSIEMMTHVLEKLKDPIYILENIPLLKLLKNDTNESTIEISPPLYYALKTMNDIFNENTNNFKEYTWVHEFDTGKCSLQLWQKLNTQFGEVDVYSCLDLSVIDLTKNSKVPFKYHDGVTPEEIIDIDLVFAQKVHLLYDAVLYDGVGIAKELEHRRYGKMEYSYINSGRFGCHDFKGLLETSGLMAGTDKELIFKIVDEKMDILIEKIIIESDMVINSSHSKKLKI